MKEHCEYLNDFQSNFEQLLLKDNTVTNHTRNLKQLATEIYKNNHHENPNFMEEIFRINESPYNLRGVTFTRNKPNTVPYGQTIYKTDRLYRITAKQLWIDVFSYLFIISCYYCIWFLR